MWEVGTCELPGPWDKNANNSRYYVGAFVSKGSATSDLHEQVMKLSKAAAVSKANEHLHLHGVVGGWLAGQTPYHFPSQEFSIMR